MTDVYAPVRLAGRPPSRGIVPVRVDALEDGELVGAHVRGPAEAQGAVGSG